MINTTLKALIASVFITATFLINVAKANDSLKDTIHTEQLILYVNINTDSPETLSDLLKGVGTKKAQAIIDYREAHGPFNTIEELLDVKGISHKILEENRQSITLTSANMQPSQ